MTILKDPPKAFISYKWEDDRHNRWVEKLARDLRENGIDAILDKWEVRLGDSFVQFMASKIGTCDVLLFIVTAKSVSALEEGSGGITYEIQLAAARKIAGENLRIIPIFREGDKIAPQLHGLRYIDFRDDSTYEKNLKDLVDDIHEIQPDKPPLKPLNKPDELDIYIKNYIDTSKFEKRKVWEDHYSLVFKEFDGEDTMYIFWNEQSKRLDKYYHLYGGVRWEGPLKLNELDKKKVRKLLNNT